MKNKSLLLTDAFEKVLNKCPKYYGLDPCIILAVLDLVGRQRLRLLKMTKTKLELISDIDMYFFLEKGTRGSIFDIKDTVKPITNA